MTELEQRIGGGAIESAVEAAKLASDAARTTEQLIEALATFMQYNPDDDDQITVPNVTVKEMKSTLAVARLGSFTEAAKAMGVSQPGLSRQVQRVEKIYGFKIFDRSVRSSPITPRGTLIIEAFSDSLSSLARSQSAVDKLS
ncbi:helix-turn-helix domain-containing protein [Candidatus Lucifugimonas marina]|jgi:predicted DNA-binding protein (UPF0251 family)|uniref:LysR family transcriptional regulator n=1 Tax=Candidatus Lucifugimonas marina TaxID=3038979 RepID=A0AAJ5ZEM1_9CHLR|nr:LysR family transcriptional regulator [SAR202 cluster bacterium JH702]MDG0869227.1 LysR family transcriptional regulator [SAR202 cluster bacterium JH639]WFG35844.1 LysR family transcriptional regulator [SAR202 cluster bacterium JH545]WFG39789.1 LysR family transcriptional regulator [SAR202 cluster bacterium JH1073]